jgi:hypothetical protein
MIKYVFDRVGSDNITNENMEQETIMNGNGNVPEVKDGNGHIAVETERGVNFCKIRNFLNLF